MKAALLLSILLLAPARGQGHLRSTSRSLSSTTNSTSSNDSIHSLVLDGLSDRIATDDGSSNVTKARKRSTTKSCLSDQRSVVIQIKTDMFGWETSWVLKGNGVTKRSPVYDSNELYTHKYCLDRGIYRFTMKDKFNDGLKNGGYYKVFVHDGQSGYRVAVAGVEFGFKETYQIDVGQIDVGQVDVGRTDIDQPDNGLTERDALYLEAHNKRRMEWHTKYDKDYIPLKWSQGLKDSSMKYATKLLETCTTGTPQHDPDNEYGENLARNKGSGSWGQLYHPDKILNRFVEREVGLPWARNGHLTNVLWRATKYVGCAEAEKTYFVKNARGIDVENTCRVQVCRYAKPGNCSMAKFRTSQGKVDWETAMMQDDSPCEPNCPPEGCF